MVTTPAHRHLAAIVLAAGMSRRMGRLKQLLPFGDKPMLARVVESLQSAQPGGPIVIVTGHAAAEIVLAVQQSTPEMQNIAFAHNAAYATGEMLSSVQTGVRALPPDVNAFLLVLGDQPGVLPSTINALCTTFVDTRAPIVQPVFNGRRGHPLLFAARCTPEILALPRGATLRDCVQQHRGEAIEVSVPDAAIVADVDTPEEYERALRLWRGSPAERCGGTPCGARHLAVNFGFKQ